MVNMINMVVIVNIVNMVNMAVIVFIVNMVNMVVTVNMVNMVNMVVIVNIVNMVNMVIIVNMVNMVNMVIIVNMVITVTNTNTHLAVICFFHFVLLFWNQVLIWTSVRWSVLESSNLLETDRYLSALNSASSWSSCLAL